LYVKILSNKRPAVKYYSRFSKIISTRNKEGLPWAGKSFFNKANNNLYLRPSPESTAGDFTAFILSLASKLYIVGLALTVTVKITFCATTPYSSHDIFTSLIKFFILLSASGIETIQ